MLFAMPRRVVQRCGYQKRGKVALDANGGFGAKDFNNNVVM